MNDEGDGMKDDKQIISAIHNSMYMQVKKQGYTTPTQVLMDIGVLSKQDYENWRFGRVDYLERVCKVNLKRLSFIMCQIRAYAAKQELKASFTFYKQWGVKKGNPRKLRFSKSGNEEIEALYGTHYVGRGASPTTARPTANNPAPKP